MQELVFNAVTICSAAVSTLPDYSLVQCAADWLLRDAQRRSERVIAGARCRSCSPSTWFLRERCELGSPQRIHTQHAADWLSCLCAGVQCKGQDWGTVQELLSNGMASCVDAVGVDRLDADVSTFMGEQELPATFAARPASSAGVIMEDDFIAAPPAAPSPSKLKVGMCLCLHADCTVQLEQSASWIGGGKVRLSMQICAAVSKLWHAALASAGQLSTCRLHCLLDSYQGEPLVRLQEAMRAQGGVNVAICDKMDVDTGSSQVPLLSGKVATLLHFLRQCQVSLLQHPRASLSAGEASTSAEQHLDSCASAPVGKPHGKPALPRACSDQQLSLTFRSIC